MSKKKANLQGIHFKKGGGVGPELWKCEAMVLDTEVISN